MEAMLDAKIGHPKAGANFALGADSPTAATFARDAIIIPSNFWRVRRDQTRACPWYAEDLLTIPRTAGRNLSGPDIAQE